MLTDDFHSDTQEIFGQDILNDEETISQPVLTKLYLICLPDHRYRLTGNATQATHYALMPSTLNDYLEFNWEVYIREEYTADELRSELRLEAIRRIAHKQLFWEREMAGLLEFGVRYEKEEE